MLEKIDINKLISKMTNDINTNFKKILNTCGNIYYNL